VTGQPSPDGSGTISGFGLGGARLNDSGGLAFITYVTGSTGTVPEILFRPPEGGLTPIVRFGDLSPDQDGTFSYFGPLSSLNASGQVAFQATLTGTTSGLTEGIFRASDGEVVKIARQGQPAPDGNGALAKTFGGCCDPPRLNEAGTVAFHATLTGTAQGNSDDEGIFAGSGGPLTQAVREGQAGPGAGETIREPSQPELNERGEIAFRAVAPGTGFKGILVQSGGTLSTIVRSGQPSPDGSGAITPSAAFRLNDSGEVVFNSEVAGSTAIFRGSGGPLTLIAREGAVLADGSGALGRLNTASLNDAGVVAFASALTATSGGPLDDYGTYRGSGGPLAETAREGQIAPGWSKPLDSPYSRALTDSGVELFYSALDPNFPVNIPFLSDGLEVVPVIEEGDFVGDSTLLLLTEADVNELGQVAYELLLGDPSDEDCRYEYQTDEDCRGHLFLFTPELHWRSASAGSWGTNSNWTLGLAPAAVHQVYIDPLSDVQVTGQSGDRTVASLFVGARESGIATLIANADGDLRIANDLTVTGRGALVGWQGSRFIVNGDALFSSTAAEVWNTELAELQLEGSGEHLLQLTGEDRGASAGGFDGNFAWGALTLAAEASLVLGDGNGEPGAALYVHALRLLGGLSQIDAIRGNGHDIYYDPFGAGNEYLEGATYPLQGGGLLQPVPEPSAALLAAAGVLALGALRLCVGQPLRPSASTACSRAHL
jgi:hypothetical protein